MITAGVLASNGELNLLLVFLAVLLGGVVGDNGAEAVRRVKLT